MHAFRDDLRRLLWQTLLLGVAVALIAVFRLRVLERRSDEQRAIAEHAERQMRELSQASSRRRKTNAGTCHGSCTITSRRS